MTLIKELNTSKKERLDKAEGFVNDCKQLMESSQAEEREILKKLGLDTHIKEVEKNVELSVLNNKYTEEYQGEIFHINELEKIALKYRLFMKKSDQYLGVIPPDLAAIVLRLVKNSKIAVSNINDFNEFYVMAPPKMFKQYCGMKDIAIEMHDNYRKDYQAFIAKLQDPILFYKVDANHFVMLKKWGNDFNISRVLYGAITKTTARIRWVGFLVFLGILGLITKINFVLVGNYTFYTEKGQISGLTQTFSIAQVILSLALVLYTVIMYIQWCSLTEKMGTKERWFNKIWSY